MRYVLEKTVSLMVNDMCIRGKPDSGADVNVMDEFQFRALQSRSTANLELQRSKIKLMALQKELPVKGEFKAILRNKTCGILLKILVVKGRINSHKLINKTTSTELGMLRIRDDGSFAEPNELRMSRMQGNVNTVTENDSTTDRDIDRILDTHNSVFKGIGKIRDTKKDKELYVS